MGVIGQIPSPSPFTHFLYSTRRNQAEPTWGYWGTLLMLLGYPPGGWGIPCILMPAACPTFMGLILGFIGGPVKLPLDAIF